MRRSLIVEQLAATLINEAMAGEEIKPIDWDHDGVHDPLFYGVPTPWGGFMINPDYYHLYQQPTHGGHDQVQGEENYIEGDWQPGPETWNWDGAPRDDAINP